MTRRRINLTTRLFGIMLILSTVLICSIGTASAANVKDTPYAFTVSGRAGRTGYRDKTNTTPVYMYYTTGTYSSVRANPMGWMISDDADLAALPHGATRSNGSTVKFVYVKKNVKSSIRTLLYESGYSSDVFIEVTSYNASSSDYIKGVWSPDSTRTYTVATK